MEILNNIKEKTFIFNGDVYNYFYHEYNSTSINERCVEIPIIWKIVCLYEGKNILEIGNTLSNYFDINYDVVDKYEKGKSCVINQDIVDFCPSKMYDLIVSISTFEHIGYDEQQKEEDKPLRAIEKVKSMLSPGGKACITIPLGYNFALDRMILTRKMKFSNVYFLNRLLSDTNSWTQVKQQDLHIEYKKPYDYIYWLAICIIDN